MLQVKKKLEILEETKSESSWQYEIIKVRA